MPDPETTLSSPLVRRPAVDLLARSLSSGDRILVTGATGWFGRTMLAMLEDLSNRSHVPFASMAAGSRPSVATTPSGARTAVLSLEDEQLRAFEPTVLIHLAFPTRNRADLLGEVEYRSQAQATTRRLLELAALSSIRFSVSISSGAAVAPRAGDEIYGPLKAAEERSLLDLARQLERAVVVLRTWAAMGPFVTHPAAYAASDFILQALRGDVITIRSAGMVWRRYASVDDLLALGVAMGAAGERAIIDSGGPTIEVGALAQRVVDLVRPGGVVRRDPRVDSDGDESYFSDNDAYEHACARVGLVPATLDEMIMATSEALREEMV